MKENKKFRKNLIKERLLLLMPLLVFMIIYLKGFSYIENQDLGYYEVLGTSLDKMIPFCEIFVVPYMLWFVYVPFNVVYLCFKDKEAYVRLAWVLCLGMSLFLVLSILAPNALNLRPEVMPRDNIFMRFVAYLYSIDTPTNVFPSIHVFNTLAVMVAVHWSSLKNVVRPVLYRVCVDIIGVSIILSTMFIKQHSVLDVMAGIFLCTLFSLVLYQSRQPAIGTVADSRRIRQM